MESNVVSIVRSGWAEGNLAGRQQADQIISDLQAGEMCPSSLRHRVPVDMAEQVGFFQRIAEALSEGQTSQAG